MKLFNTLAHKKEEFKPNKPDEIGVYSCGPTVYDSAHIGNLRSFLTADILVRALKSLNLKVKWVMNITDIDDKTIAGAQKAGKSLKEFTSQYEQKFFDDIAKLNIAKADQYPKATDHFAEMREIVERLTEKEIAYETYDGVYFSIEKFPDYGKLSGLDKRELKPGARVDVDTYDKQSPGDFALWKLETGNWKMTGRPGWSLECSAMSRKYLGQPFDIHTGGVDLMFPHHENEIAQSMAAYGEPLAKIFVHNEHLLVDGKKMAKSDGNYITLDTVIEKGFDPLALRYLFLQTHYREKMNFTWEALEGAQNAIKGIRETIQRQPVTRNSKLEDQIKNALKDDLNTPKALGLLHEAGDSRLWVEFDEVLGLGLSAKKVELTKDQEKLLEERGKLRKQGKFAEADKIRIELEKQGIKVEDTPEGPQILTL